MNLGADAPKELRRQKGSCPEYPISNPGSPGSNDEGKRVRKAEGRKAEGQDSEF